MFQQNADKVYIPAVTNSVPELIRCEVSIIKLTILEAHKSKAFISGHTSDNLLSVSWRLHHVEDIMLLQYSSGHTISANLSIVEVEIGGFRNLKLIAKSVLLLNVLHTFIRKIQ